MRISLLFLLLLLFVVVDPILSHLTDPQALKGYASAYFPQGPYWGVERVEKNISHFFLFWVKPPKAIHGIKDFLTCDGNGLAFNLIGHGGTFGLYGFFLPLLGVGTATVFLTGLFITLYHEYVAEGLYCDPSSCDLWLSTLALVVGLFLARAIKIYTE